jgi:hypothetical protein
MNLEYEIVYVKNKEYVYVLTNNVDNYNVLDLSIFEIEEWTHLTKISKVFEDAVVNLDVDISLRPYINVSKDIKKGVYYLYYSPFCNWKGFNDLEYEMLEINNIYEVVFNFVKEHKKITINDFRKWIIDNYTNILMHYDNILNNKINLFIPFSFK